MVQFGRLNYDEDVHYRGEEIKFVNKVKYLGVVISSTLRFKDHITYVEEKSAKIIKLLHYANHLTGGLTISQKMIIYKQIWLPSVLYGRGVWFEKLPGYLRSRLHSVQRQMVLAMTGAFRTTNTAKLLNLLDILDVKREVQCLTECRKSEEDPKKIRQRYLEEQRSCTLGGYSLPFDIAQLRRKEPFWFITKHGPFRHHLAKMNKKRPSVCRFCVRRLEDADHLLHDCDELGPSHYTSIAEFEERCQAIARQIFSSGD